MTPFSGTSFSSPLAISRVDKCFALIAPGDILGASRSGMVGKIATLLLQLRVLRFGFFQDRNVGVGVFPEGKEFFVGGERPDAGGVGIRSMRVLRPGSVRTSLVSMCHCS